MKVDWDRWRYLHETYPKMHRLHGSDPLSLYGICGIKKNFMHLTKDWHFVNCKRCLAKRGVGE